VSDRDDERPVALEPTAVAGTAQTLPGVAVAARAEPAAARDGLRPGTVVGRFVVERKVGAGGMGEVYAAYDPHLDRRVAIKILQAGARGADAATRLVREAQALAKLAHPNVVAVHEVGETVDKEVVLAAQTKAKTNEPGPDDIFPVGTLGHIVQLLHLPDGTVKVIVEGKQRVRLGEFLSLDPYLSVEVEPLAELAEPSDPDVEALMRSVRATFDTYVKLNKRIPHDTLTAVGRLESAARLADTIVGYLTLKLVDKQGLLELLSARARLERLHELMQAEIEILQVERKIRTRVKKQMEKTQKEYYLNEQMQAIQKELGERDELKNELVELEERSRRRPCPRTRSSARGRS
jgi:ATP-dependent Lon protease